MAEENNIENGNNEIFVLYSKRPEWSDIEPIPQYDESKPRLVNINYEKECKLITKKMSNNNYNPL